MNTETQTEKTVDKTVPLELVKQTAEKLLGYLSDNVTIKCSVESIGRKRSAIKIKIDTEDSRRLIGQYGATLQAMQYIVRLLISAQTGRPSYATIDVNDYKAQQEQKIIDAAQEGAQKALRTDSMVILRPMSSYERRVVHVALQENKAVTTESLGQDPNRRVVIKPTHESRVVQSFAQKGFTLDDIKL